jgi:hypothetical protein
MRFRAVARALAVLAGGTLAGLSAQSGVPACTASLLAGRYAIQIAGIVPGGNPAILTQPYPSAEIGILSFDGAGSFTGADTHNNAGSVTRNKLTGTYTVNADCTGSITLNAASFTDPSNAPWVGGAIVILLDGRQVNLLLNGPPIMPSCHANEPVCPNVILAGGTLSCVGVRSVPAACGASLLKGKYAISFSGAVMGYSEALAAQWSPGTEAEIGILDFDGAGNFSGTDTYSNLATTTPFNLAGTYTVNADCTGSIALTTASSSGTWNGGDIVVLSSGQEVNFLKTDPMTPQGVWDIYAMLAGVMTHQNTVLMPPPRVR